MTEKDISKKKTVTAPAVGKTIKHPSTKHSAPAKTRIQTGEGWRRTKLKERAAKEAKK